MENKCVKFSMRHPQIIAITVNGNSRNAHVITIIIKIIDVIK